MAKQEEKDIKHIRSYLKNKIINYKTSVGHDKEWNQLFELLKQTILFGVSNSVLLIGPRDCGKTTLIQDVLRSFEGDKTFAKDFILVKLHGLIHTDDRLALNSTTSQMKLENVVDGKVFGSFAENLTFLLSCLRTGEKHTSKSVIFLLEEFDLFCSHHNQTLLYNLFDVSQSAQAPICVIGVTCRLDIVELLEKRVKSRFSHRQIFLFPGPEGDYISNLDNALCIIERYLRLLDDSSLTISNSRKKQWNVDLQSILQNKNFKKIIQRLVDIDNTEATLRNILINIVFDLKESKLTVDQFQEQLDLIEKDDIIQVLQDLTALELCLIIAMKHHNEIYDAQPMNFEMILTRYIKFANANSNIQTIQRPVIMKAFEHIQNLELISLIQSTGTRTQKEYQFFKLLVTPQQISEAVKKSVGLPTEVVQWANSSLV